MSQIQQSEIDGIRRRCWRRLSVGICLLSVVVGAVGCHREHYRRQADRDAYRLIEEKVNDPRWALPRVDISVDPRSRMFDPFDPDHEPMPVDDHLLGALQAGMPNCSGVALGLDRLLMCALELEDIDQVLGFSLGRV